MRSPAARTGPGGSHSCAAWWPAAWVQLVVFDAHTGLVEAIGATLPGASWRRCRTCYLRNLLTTVPTSAQLQVATLVRTIVDQPTASRSAPSTPRSIDALAVTYLAAADHLDAAWEDLLAVAAFPWEVGRQIWPDNP